MNPEPPIILTIQFDEKSDLLFRELRRAHYPQDIDRVAAHLTLFHNLPGTEEKLILAETAALAAKTAPFRVRVAGPMRLGRGVALKIESETLDALRASLADRFRPWLKGHDREKFRAHVTVQNKVAAHEAAALFDHLGAQAAFDAIAEGIQLWLYVNKSWRPIASVPFQGPQGVARP